MALEVRLHGDARVTKDIDLGLRAEITDATDLHERLIESLVVDVDSDGFDFLAGVPEILRTDAGGHPTWRVRITAKLALRPFGAIPVDISPRAHELLATDRLSLPKSPDFSGVPTRTMEVVDVHRHAAEKFHAMLRDFGDRENSRVQDLLDLVLLSEHDLLAPAGVAAAARQVWAERDGTPPPTERPLRPESWPHRYEHMAADHDLTAAAFPDTYRLVSDLWRAMHTTAKSPEQR